MLYPLRLHISYRIAYVAKRALFIDAGAKSWNFFLIKLQQTIYQ